MTLVMRFWKRVWSDWTLDLSDRIPVRETTRRTGVLTNGNQTFYGSFPNALQNCGQGVKICKESDPRGYIRTTAFRPNTCRRHLLRVKPTQIRTRLHDRVTSSHVALLMSTVFFSRLVWHFCSYSTSVLARLSASKR